MFLYIHLYIYFLIQNFRNTTVELCNSVSWVIAFLLKIHVTLKFRFSWEKFQGSHERKEKYFVGWRLYCELYLTLCTCMNNKYWGFVAYWLINISLIYSHILKSLNIKYIVGWEVSSPNHVHPDLWIWSYLDIASK